MRKGRSSRRSRSSRPLVGSKPPAAVDVLGAEASPPESSIASEIAPRVVVGIPPSDPPPSEASENPTSAIVETRSGRTDPPPSFGTATLVHGSSVPGPSIAPPADVAASTKRSFAATPESEPPRDPDEMSVPPAAEVAIDEKFFSEGEIARHVAGDSLVPEELALPEKVKRKAQPEVAARRARFGRYVKWAVAGAAVVCLAAVGRTSMTKAPRAVVTSSAPAHAAPAVKAAPPVTSPIVAEPPVARPEPPPAASAEPAAAEEISGDPKEEKAKARKLLETRKIAEAIEAGKRAVALDPTDGEAWLILGASYQEKGNLADAHRAYASCVKEGKTGPRHECVKMLR